MSGLHVEEYHLVITTNQRTGEMTYRIRPLNQTSNQAPSVPTFLLPNFGGSRQEVNWNPFNTSFDPFQSLLQNSLDEIMNSMIQEITNPQEDVRVTLSEDYFNSFETVMYSGTNSSPTEDTCIFCQTKYGEQERVVICPCRHRFHYLCAKQWFTQFSVKCPVCRYDTRIPTTD